MLIDISIHAPLTGSDSRGCPCFLEVIMISIHAPLTGSDKESQIGAYTNLISIHAPLTGSDFRVFSWAKRIRNFNPRSPYGERHFEHHIPPPIQLFQSTLPLRGATRYNIHQKHPQQFQSTLPLRGATFWTRTPRPRRNDFNPRSPYGERPPDAPTSGTAKNFNPRSPYGERPVAWADGRRLEIFQSTLPLRGATIGFMAGFMTA